MIYSIEKIAKILNGKVLGDSNVSINMLSKIEEGTKGSLSFLANSKYEEFLYTTKASAVIIASDFNIDYSRISTNLIIVDDAYQGFATMLQTFSESRNTQVLKSPPLLAKNVTSVQMFTLAKMLSLEIM